MRPIRILQIIDSLSPDGAERQLLGLCRRLDRSRFDVTVLCYEVVTDSLADAFQEAAIPAVVLDKRSMPLWRFLRELSTQIRELAPDIVHTWLSSANFWGRWAAVASGVRCLIASDRAIVEGRWSGRRLVERASEVLLARRTVRLANSMAVARSLEYSYGLPLERTRIIRNAVEMPTCDRSAARDEIRRELGVPGDRKLVLMVAREAEQKNWPMFLRVAQRLAAARDDITCVGLGRRHVGGRLDMLRDALGVAATVRLVSQRTDVYRWLAAADVFCLTSNTEGTPNALLEAMWVGLPVVCTSFPGAGEIITDGSVALQVRPNDHVAMAECVSELFDDEPRRQALGKRAQEWVAKQYSWGRLVGEMEALYASVADAAGSPLEQRASAQRAMGPSPGVREA